jgi:hypothetical protein
MDAFLYYVLKGLREHGAQAVRVFPLEAGVPGMFAERVSILFVISSYLVLDLALGGC